MPRIFSCSIGLLAGFLSPLCSNELLAEAEVGEFVIPNVYPLNPLQLKQLRQHSSADEKTQTALVALRAQIDPFLRHDPKPVSKIYYEGLVNTDPRRIQALKHLREMEMLALLVRYCQVTDDEPTIQTIKRFVNAWSSTYRPDGNDVNENKLCPLLIAYHQLYEQFSDEERKMIQAWIETLGSFHYQKVRNTTQNLSNRYTKSLRLLSLCGTILQREAWIQAMHAGFKRFVEESLYADGSSLDFKHRDTLTYHCSALRPVVELAMLSGAAGQELYTWTSAKGASLKKSVEFVRPYAMGEKTHREWVNSKATLDRERAKAGIEKYRPGRLFDPQDALDLMSEASYFDAQLIQVVAQLTNDSNRERLFWQRLYNRACTPTTESTPAKP